MNPLLKTEIHKPRTDCALLKVPAKPFVKTFEASNPLPHVGLCSGRTFSVREVAELVG